MCWQYRHLHKSALGNYAINSTILRNCIDVKNYRDRMFMQANIVRQCGNETLPCTVFGRRTSKMSDNGEHLKQGVNLD